MCGPVPIFSYFYVPQSLFYLGTSEFMGSVQDCNNRWFKMNCTQLNTNQKWLLNTELLKLKVLKNGKNCQHILWTAPKYFKILLDKDHGPTTLKYVITPLQDYSYTSYTSERYVSIFTPVTGWCPNLKTAEMYVVTTHKPRERAWWRTEFDTFFKVLILMFWGKSYTKICLKRGQIN